jgi:hypothetical protein
VFPVAEEGRMPIILNQMSHFNIRGLTLQTVCLCISFLAIDAKGAEKMRVSLGVAGPDDIKGEIINDLSRELRQLQDVDLVDRNFDYQVRIIAVHLESKKGRGTGYAVSVLVTTQFPGGQTDGVFKHPVVAHFLEIAPRGGLQDLCRRVAAAINDQVFEVHRKAKQSFR